jgi:hypothetical protein
LRRQYVTPHLIEAPFAAGVASGGVCGTVTFKRGTFSVSYPKVVSTGAPGCMYSRAVQSVTGFRGSGEVVCRKGRRACQDY